MSPTEIWTATVIAAAVQACIAPHCKDDAEIILAEHPLHIAGLLPAMHKGGLK